MVEQTMRYAMPHSVHNVAVKFYRPSLHTQPTFDEVLPRLGDGIQYSA